MRHNCNNWTGAMCDAFHRTGVHDPACCNARNQGPNPHAVPLTHHGSQIFVVIIYPSGKKHVAPLYPHNLTELSALEVAKAVAHEEGLGREAFGGDRVRFCSVKAQTTMQAAGMIVTVEDFDRCAVHGEFTL